MPPSSLIQMQKSITTTKNHIEVILVRNLSTSKSQLKPLCSLFSCSITFNTIKTHNFYCNLYT
ncbi:hypothetical protein Peur_072103 [Populus x canadensis]